MKRILLTFTLTLASAAGLFYFLPVSRTGVLASRTSRSPSNSGESNRADSTRSNASQSDLVRAARLPVEGVRVERAPFVGTVTGVGRTEASERATLAFRVGDRVARVRVQEGQAVEKGEVLIELDAATYEMAVREAEAAVASARLQYEGQLFADSSAGEEKKARVAARTGLTGATQRLDRARLDLDGTILRAPFAGEIVELRVHEGERATPDQPAVLLIDRRKLRLPAEVLESDFGQLKVGAHVRTRFTALPDEPFHGTVRALSPVIRADRGTGLVYVELDNPDGRLRPGMYGEVTLDARRFEDRLCVPRSALLERDRRLLVFRVRDGRAEWSYVETGLESESTIEITSGLESGDTVLVGGHLTLAHGAPVRVLLQRAAHP